MILADFEILVDFITIANIDLTLFKPCVFPDEIFKGDPSAGRIAELSKMGSWT